MAKHALFSHARTILDDAQVPAIKFAAADMERRRLAGEFGDLSERVNDSAWTFRDMLDAAFRSGLDSIVRDYIEAIATNAKKHGWNCAACGWHDYIAPKTTNFRHVPECTACGGVSWKIEPPATPAPVGPIWRCSGCGWSGPDEPVDRDQRDVTLCPSCGSSAWPDRK